MGLFILRLIVLLPYALQLHIGSLLGIIFKKLSPRRRFIIDKNLSLCFPHLSKQELTKLRNKNFHFMGQGLVEMAMSWWAPNQCRKLPIKIEGLKPVKLLIKTNPIILVGVHFTPLELTGKLMRPHFCAAAIYRPLKNKLFDNILFTKRSENFKSIIHRKDARKIIATLKNKIPLWLAPDQDYGAKHSVFAPFFGIPTATITSISKLAKIKDVKVVPVIQYRLSNNKGYGVNFLPPLESFPTDSFKKDATIINQIIETAIREYPEQYLWCHRRFKTRPPGEASFYAR